MLYLIMSGWDNVAGIVTGYRLGGSAFKARFSRPFQTGLIHCILALFPGVKWPGCGINYPPSLVKKLKKE